MFNPSDSSKYNHDAIYTAILSALKPFLHEETDMEEDKKLALILSAITSQCGEGLTIISSVTCKETSGAFYLLGIEKSFPGMVTAHQMISNLKKGFIQEGLLPFAKEQFGNLDPEDLSDFFPDKKPK